METFFIKVNEFQAVNISSMLKIKVYNGIISHLKEIGLFQLGFGIPIISLGCHYIKLLQAHSGIFTLRTVLMAWI